MRHLRHRLLTSTLLLATSATAATELEHVLVTATRVARDGMPTPLAYTGLAKEDVALVAAVHPSELMQRVPGTWISRGNGQESLTALRSPVLTGAGGCGPFLMAADSISLRAPGFCNVNQLFDANLEQAGRVEVIKGPATALYGTSAMHGVINVLSPAPADESPQSLALELGPNDYYRGRYRYSGTRGDHGFSLRFNGTSDGGYLDDAGFDQQKLSLRHDYAGSGWQFQSVLEGSNLNQETAGFIEGYRAYDDSDLRRTNPNPEAYRDAWSMRAYSQASTELDSGLQVQLTPYFRRNDMTFLQHYLPWQAVEENGHESVGLRAVLRGDGERWQWVTGAETEFTEGWLLETQPEPFSPNQPQGVHYDYTVDANTSALFGQTSWQPGTRWNIDGGLRLERTRYDYQNHVSAGPACGPEASDCRFYRPADRVDEFDDWSVNLGASYEFATQHFVYLRAANGFRAPETAELYRLQAGQRVADLDSEELVNIETGLRGLWGAGLYYTVALYHMKKDEVIFQDADRQNVSGASTRHKGLELSLDYRWGDNWYAGLDVTWAQHTYDSNAPLLGVEGNIKGNDIDTAPRDFGSARLGWEGSLVRAELEWVHLGDYYLEPTNSYSYAGHDLLNLRASTELGRGLSATLRVTNLTDEYYAERADFGFGEYRYFVGQPRSVYLELRYTAGG